MRVLLNAAFIAVMGTSFAAAEEVEHYNSGKVVPTTLPFSELVIAGETLYLSGQIGNVPGTLTLAEGGVEGQARQVMTNIKTSLEVNGYAMENLVKCVVMLEDMSQWSNFNTVYAEFFEQGKYPARAAFGSAGLAIGAALEVDCVGHK